MQTTIFSKSSMVAIGAGLALSAGSVHAAPFMDDFESDTSGNYTHTDTYNGPGSFNISGGQLSLSAMYNNTSTVFHNTAQLEAGEYLAVDVPELVQGDFGLSISTGPTAPNFDGAPNSGGEDGFRFFYAGSWILRVVEDNDRILNLNVSEPAASEEDPFSMYIYRHGDTSYSVGVDVGDGVEMLEFDVDGDMTDTFELAGTSGQGLSIGLENYGYPSAASIPFDNLRIAAIPEPGSLALLGAAGGLMLMRRRRA